MNNWIHELRFLSNDDWDYTALNVHKNRKIQFYTAYFENCRHVKPKIGNNQLLTKTGICPFLNDSSILWRVFGINPAWWNAIPWTIYCLNLTSTTLWEILMSTSFCSWDKRICKFVTKWFAVISTLFRVLQNILKN